VVISNDGKYKFKHNFVTEGTLAGEIVSFAKPLHKALKELKDEEIMFEIETDKPLVAKVDKKDVYNFTILVAPTLKTQ